MTEFQKKMLQLYDEACSRLIVQNAKATDKSEMVCVLHAKNGNKCGVGHLISENFYRKELDGDAYMWDEIKRAVCQTNRLKVDTDEKKDDLDFMLSQLQYLHDAYSPEHWRNESDKLREVIKGRYDCGDSDQSDKKKVKK